jgi:hypothetical protein
MAHPDATGAEIREALESLAPSHRVVGRIGPWSGTVHARHGFAVNYGASVPPAAAIGLERPSVMYAALFKLNS